MKYYIITSAEYVNHTSNLTQPSVRSVDGTKYVIEVEDDYNVPNYLNSFNTSNECNDYRFDWSTQEWKTWLTQEERDE